jgi:hypothetical protein
MPGLGDQLLLGREVEQPAGAEGRTLEDRGRADGAAASLLWLLVVFIGQTWWGLAATPGFPAARGA